MSAISETPGDDDAKEIVEEKSDCLDVKARSVLVVEDSPMTRKMVCKALEATKSFRCDQAEDGSVAVEMVRRQLAAAESAPQACSYDLILMDYQMPNMDGPTAISEIRSLGYKNPILGLTGNALQKDMDHMVACGADAVLLKPLSMDRFWDVLNRLLRN